MYHQQGTANTCVNAELMTFVKNATAFARHDLECLDEYFICLILRLHKLNSDLAEQFEKMMKELRKASLVFRKLSSNAMSIQKKQLEIVYKHMEVLLMNWSSLMESQWRHFKKDFADYFKYYMFEGEAMLELARTQKNAEQTYLAKETELSIIKHKLFKEKNFDKWKLLPEDRKIFEETTLIHNKKLSFPKMLPNETKVVEDLFLKYGYYLNRMKVEVDRILEERVKDMLSHFVIVSDNYAKTSRELTNIWLEFEEKIGSNNKPKRTELHVYLDIEDETEASQLPIKELTALANNLIETSSEQFKKSEEIKSEREELKENNMNVLNEDIKEEMNVSEQSEDIRRLESNESLKQVENNLVEELVHTQNNLQKIQEDNEVNKDIEKKEEEHVNELEVINIKDTEARNIITGTEANEIEGKIKENETGNKEECIVEEQEIGKSEDERLKQNIDATEEHEAKNEEYKNEEQELEQNIKGKEIKEHITEDNVIENKGETEIKHEEEYTSKEQETIEECEAKNNEEEFKGIEQEAKQETTERHEDKENEEELKATEQENGGSSEEYKVEENKKKQMDEDQYEGMSVMSPKEQYLNNEEISEQQEDSVGDNAHIKLS